MRRKRTTCRKGLHRLTRANTRTRTDGSQTCLDCRRTAKRRYDRAHRDQKRAYDAARHRRTYVSHGTPNRDTLKARLVAHKNDVESDRILPLVRWMVDRWGVTMTAKAVGVSRQTIRNVLHGKAVRSRTARKVVNVMNYQAGQREIRAGRVAA